MALLKFRSGKEINQKTDFESDWTTKDWLHKSILKKWLTVRQNGWVTGSLVWKEYQEMLEELTV